jgi:hypothetical protein
MRRARRRSLTASREGHFAQALPVAVAELDTQTVAAEARITKLEARSTAVQAHDETKCSMDERPHAG